MDIYKQGIRSNLKFQTTRGLLTIHQLFSLPISELDTLAVELDEELEKSGKKTFLTKKSEKSKLAKLRFDIVLDVLTTLADEEKSAQEAADVKEHNQKIDNLIANKREKELQEKSIEELEALRK
jgi:hypothetical protein